MKIVLVGASGNIGSKILAEAADRNHEVTAVARGADKIASRPGVSPVSCDVSDAAALAGIIKGADAVVVSVDWAKTDVDKVVEACRLAGVKRVLTVGGASSLVTASGQRLLDSPGFPSFLKPIVQPAIDGLERMRKIEDLDWTYVSPSQTIEAGERTGKFRIAGDELLVDANGLSRITQEDFAIAILDEIEKPAHIRARFTVGY